MTTQSITTGWIIFRIQNGKPEFFGIEQDRERAQADIECLNKHMTDRKPWSIAPAPLVGWGQISSGAFGQNNSKTILIWRPQ